MPSAVARVLRQPARTVAILLLAATALASAGIQSAAAAMLQATVGANWRGAYDILVTPADAMKPIDGLLPPNTLTSSTTGMTIKDLARVRKVSGVGIAAPIGEILLPNMHVSNADLTLPASIISAARTAPQSYKITETFTTDDGLGERVIAVESFALIVDDTHRVLPSQLARCMANQTTSTEGRFGSYPVDGKKYPLIMREICQSSLDGGQVAVIPDGGTPQSGASGIPIADDTTALDVSLPVSLQSSTRITLVDPVAEKQLLGASGDFLDPLLDIRPTSSTGISEMLSWAKRAGTPYADNLEQYLTGQSPTPGAASDVAEYTALFKANGDDYAKYLKANQDAMRYVPLVISQQPVSKLAVKLDIDETGPAKVAGVAATVGPRSYVVPRDSRKTEIGTSAGDVSALLNPFVGGADSLSWPGTTSGTRNTATPSAIGLVQAVSHPLPSWYHVGQNGVTLAASGYQASAQAADASDPTAALAADANPRTTGSEAIYNGGIDPTAQAHSVGATLTVPVGSFDPAKIADESAASYVPLGAYGEVSSTLTSGHHAGATMQPSVTGLGLVSSRTAAVASINSAGTWGGAAPVDAIRVRVAGITGYTMQAQQKVIDVAQSIRALGFDATVMAGASPSATDVTVTGYAFGTADPAGTQRVGTLGAVTQDWSELGAASRVSLFVGAGTYAILGIALITAMLLLGGSLLVSIPMQREQSATMRLAGLTRSRIVRWHAAEEVPGLVIILGVSAMAVALSGGNTVTGLIATVAVVAMTIAAGSSVIAGSVARAPARIRDARSRRHGARTVAGFGARQVIVHPLGSVLAGAGYTVVGLATASLFVAILSTREASGHSTLALLTLGRTLLPQIVLGLAGVTGGILLARTMRRIELSGRGEQWDVLRAAGWTTRHVAIAQHTEVFGVAAPAVLLSAGLAWGAGAYLGLPLPGWDAAIAAAAASLTALLTATVRRKGSVR